MALIGGAEWQPGCEFDAELLALAGGEVLVVPTAAAYEHPERAVATAEEWFSKLGGRAMSLPVLGRSDAQDRANAETARAAKFIYLGGGSPLHLRSVMKASIVWEAIREAWRSGAVLAGSSAGAMVLGDPMVDPRGGAYTLGLGLVPQMAVVPHYGSWSKEKAGRTVKLASAGVVVAGIEERTGLVREPDGTWRVVGNGGVTLWLEGQEVGTDALPHPVI
ncbi:MAG: Type 1 glutamine amidotransferase-like domain-containing protein [Actinomycetota bacterium]|nr:Type 1 glutamine amidotransferase-like domain-containing protein [Actinomycetota bacterium]